MGLIKAITGATGGVLADQWLDFYYCDSIDANTLVAKGQKRVSGRSSNTKGEPNIISNGSGIAVNEGQCMIIVDNGKIVELCAEPGQYTYDASTEPSIFSGPLGDGIIDSFKNIGTRFTFGGSPGKDQRIYFFNTKEIIGNKYGTVNPIPFRIVDENIGFDSDLDVRCNGEFSYKITDPIKFYVNVCGNIEDTYTRDKIDSQLKSELLTALQPAFAKISAMGIRYSAVPGHTLELAKALNDVLSETWSELRGIEVASFGMNSITADPEDIKNLKDLQMAAALRDPNLRAGLGSAASSEAMRSAAQNEAGAMTGFMGMGMAGFMGNQVQNASVQMPQGEAPQYQNQYPTTAGGGFVTPEAAKSSQGTSPDGWTCSCGTTNTGKFCSECGTPKPAAPESWTCSSCGTSNTGKFCSECGTKKPEGASHYKCDKCGWTPEDPTNPPKFCPECGDPFNEADRT